MRLFLLLLLCEVSFPAYGQEEEMRLKELVENAQSGATEEKRKEHSEEQGSQEERSSGDVLSGLAREVEELRSRVAVSAAVRQATNKPEAVRSLGSKTYYSYKEGGIYAIHAGVDRVTDIELQVGEKLTNQPVAGDTVRWTIGTIKSSSPKGEQIHLVLKPLEEDLDTNLIVTTNRRVYHLQLTSSDWYMPTVAWHYPEDDESARQVALEKESVEERITFLPEKLSFDYEVVHNDESWAPLQCFDDGQKTYLQMPKKMAVSEAPALFILGDEKQTLLVNYRVKGDYYIVDRLFDRAELRIGTSEPVVVYSGRKPRSFWERIF